MSFSNHSHKSKQIFFYQSQISILLDIYIFFLQIIFKIGILISKVVELEKQYRSSVFDIPVYFFMDYCNPLRKKNLPKDTGTKNFEFYFHCCDIQAKF